MAALAVSSVALARPVVSPLRRTGAARRPPSGVLALGTSVAHRAGGAVLLPKRVVRAAPVGRTTPLRPVAAASSSTALVSQVQEPQKNGLVVLAAAVAGALKQAAERLSTAFKNAVARSTKDIDSEEVNRQVKAAVKQMKVLWMVAPFAAVSSSSSSNMFLLITRAVASFIKLYLLLLFLRVLLSWFPTFDWMQQPWLALRQVTDPYLNLFRGIVPPLLGTIDFTPLLGFFILQFLAGALDLGDDQDAW